MSRATVPAPTVRPLWRDPLHRAVHTLGIVQIVTWGTSYYCLGVLASSIVAELGFTRSFVFLGFTVSVLVMGAVSASAGKLIDARGGRAVMSVGIVAVSLGLAGLATVQGPWTYLAAWAFLGLAMRLCLYDAAFASLVQVTPTRGRTAISYLTLYGAFASSVFWVVGHYLDEAIGWRATLLAFAAINLVLCLPLVLWGLAERESVPAEATAAAVSGAGGTVEPPLEGRARNLAIALFAAVMSLNGFLFGVVSVQLVPLLEASGLAAATAVWIASLKGFAQFAGRIVEIVFGKNLAAMTVARIAIGVLPFSLLLLMAGQGLFWAVLAFTLIMGASQGVLTIVRGAVPLALFGAKGYGSVLGLIATPVLIVSAGSPTLFALVIDRWGWDVARLVLLGGALAAWASIEAMNSWYRRHRASAASG
jgi:hypothetical protein